MGGGKELIADKEIECKYQLSYESSEELKPELAERRTPVRSREKEGRKNEKGNRWG